MARQYKWVCTNEVKTSKFQKCLNFKTDHSIQKMIQMDRHINKYALCARFRAQVLISAFGTILKIQTITMK